MVTLEMIKDGFKDYYRECVAPLNWKLSMLEPVIHLGLKNVERQYSQFIDMITDDHGHIDVDHLFSEYKLKIQEHGPIEMWGIKFNIDDVTKFYEHIKRHQVN